MKKKDTIDRIIAAAKSEITVRGVDGAKVENIAKEAGVTKQLIYHYFKTKDLLYSATLESVAKNIDILSEVEEFKELSGRRAISRVIDMIVDEFISNPGYAALTLDQALHSGEHISESSEFIPKIKLFIAEVISPILERGVERGEFKKGFSPEVVFWIIFNLATASFLNKNIMSSASSIDFGSDEGIELWRRATTEFVLNGLQVS
jgi:AcrR family transcriptional regulator